MPKINLKKAEEAKENPVVEETKVDTTDAKPVADKKANESKDSTTIKEFLISKGKDGAMAQEIAEHLGWIDKSADKAAIKQACYKVRRLVRPVVDKTDGGSRKTRNGRNVVYMINQ